jgi:hypothetical protein
VLQTNYLVGYALAEYAHGVDGDPTYLPWLDNYIEYARKLTQDLPSSSQKDLPSSSQKDLPSKPKTSRKPRRAGKDLPSKPKKARTPRRS